MPPFPPGCNARIGIGDTKFTAFVAARTAPALSIAAVLMTRPGFLAHKPIDLLPVSGELKRSLRSFGVHGMGQLAALSPDILTDRFGAEGRLAWELCNGIDDRPVLPVAPVVSVVERASLPFASASLELLLATADILLRRAFGSAELRRSLVGSVTLTATSPDAADLDALGSLQGTRGELGARIGTGQGGCRGAPARSAHRRPDAYAR